MNYLSRTSKVLVTFGAMGLSMQGWSQASFQGLGWLSGGVTPVSRAYAISDNGVVVVGSSSSSIGKQSYRWTAGGGMSGLGILPGGTSSSARRVSATGTVIVGESGTSTGELAFRWTSATGMVSLGDLAGGSDNSNALGVSGDGSVVVGEGHIGSHRAFRWTSASGMVNLGLLSGAAIGESHAYDVTADGSTVCGYSTDSTGTILGFLWKASTGMTSIGDLLGGTVESRAYGMSRNGAYVTGRSDAGTNLAFRAFRWNPGKMLNLGVLVGHRTSRGRAVTNDGTAVVGRCGNDTVIPELLTAFLWTDRGGMQDLKSYLTANGVSNVGGWQLEEAEGMTPDGKYVVGHGTNPAGQTEAWLVRLPVRVTSNALSLASVYGGTPVTGTVQVSYPSATQTTVSLSSSNTSAATVPASVTIPAGQTSATYTITTKGVAALTTVNITASLPSGPRVAVVTVKATSLKSYTASPSPFYGGVVLTGKVSLNGGAPAGGAAITLASDNATLVPVPASITIPAGIYSGSYSVSTKGVASDTAVTLTASYGGLAKTINLLVKVPVLSSLSLMTNPVQSGNNLTVSVTLLGKAAAGGKIVTLSAADPTLLSIPSSVTVPAGLSTASVVATAAAVGANSTVGVSASAGVLKTATLTILAPSLNQLTLSTTQVKGGSNVTGTVSLTGYAPASGVQVNLSSSDTSAVVPANVTVRSGTTKVTFTITTSIVLATRTATISATRNGITRQVVLTITP